MQGKLLIAHIPSSDQPADLVPKAASKSKFSWLRDKVMVRDFQQLSNKGQTRLGLRGLNRVN